MSRFESMMSAAAFAAVLLSATPGLAQEHQRGARTRAPEGSEQKTNSGQATRRAEAANAARAERPAAVAPREERQAAAVPRERGTAAAPNRDLCVAVPRAERPVVVAPRVEHPVVVAPRVAPRYVYRAPYYAAPVYRPYIFRPRVSVGLGLFVGYPVPYSYSYAYPIHVYGYRAPVAPVLVGPGTPYYGGISLEIWPSDATVYVDGAYAGIVADFDGTRQPLTVMPGTHRIEVQAAGLVPLVFDVTVQPGQVIPYQGQLQPY
jgi:PEGA domain